MEELIIAALKALSDAKRDKGVEPTYVLFSELATAMTSKVKMELNRLCREKKVVWHKTLNEVAFKVSDNNNPEPVETVEENNDNNEAINKLINA